MHRSIPLFVLLLLFAGAVVAQPRTYTVPFREINHRILVEVEAESKRHVLLFDTGARLSVLFGQKQGFDCRLRIEHRYDELTLSCDGEASVAFQKAEVEFDGFLGGDLLSKFAVVRINYRTKTIELEQ